MGPKAMVLKVSHICNHKRKESFVLSLVFGLLCLILLTGHCEAGSGSSSSNSSISIGSSKRDRLVFFCTLQHTYMTWINLSFSYLILAWLVRFAHHHVETVNAKGKQGIVFAIKDGQGNIVHFVEEKSGTIYDTSKLLDFCTQWLSFVTNLFSLG